MLAPQDFVPILLDLLLSVSLLHVPQAQHLVMTTSETRFKTKNDENPIAQECMKHSLIAVIPCSELSDAQIGQSAFEGQNFLKGQLGNFWANVG